MYYAQAAIMQTPAACIADLTPPTFAGIVSLAAQVNGSLLASWLAATDPSDPITYDVFIALGVVTASSLFLAANRAQSVAGLQTALFQLPSGALLQDGQVYTVGVQARDAVGNVTSVTALLTATSTGVSAVNLSEVLRQLHILAATTKCGPVLKVAQMPELSAKIAQAPEVRIKITDAVDLDC